MHIGKSLHHSIFSLLYFNVRSLLPKIDEFRIICSVSKLDVVCITESWLDSTIDDCEISIQGYSVFRLDRSRHGGGVLIYVKSLFTCSILFKGTTEFECIVINIACSVNPSLGSDVSICLFYRPPGSVYSLLDTLFDTLCNIFVSLASKFFLIGDFNIDFLTPSFLYHKLLSIVTSFNLTQVVKDPTRVCNSCSTLIDLIFVSPSVNIDLCSTIPPLLNSDHFGVHLRVPMKYIKKRPKPIVRKIWRYTLADFD